MCIRDRTGRVREANHSALIHVSAPMPSVTREGRQMATMVTRRVSSWVDMQAPRSRESSCHQAGRVREGYISLHPLNYGCGYAGPPKHLRNPFSFDHARTDIQ